MSTFADTQYKFRDGESVARGVGNFLLNGREEKISRRNVHLCSKSRFTIVFYSSAKDALQGCQMSNLQTFGKKNQACIYNQFHQYFINSFLNESVLRSFLYKQFVLIIFWRMEMGVRISVK